MYQRKLFSSVLLHKLSLPPLGGKHSILSLLMSAYPYFFIKIIGCDKIDCRDIRNYIFVTIKY